MATSIRIETWVVREQPRDPVTGRFLPATGRGRRHSRVVIRDEHGRIDGATNYRQVSRVGQVARARR